MALPLLIPVLVAGGGVAYVAATAGPDVAPVPQAIPPARIAPNGGSTIAQATAFSEPASRSKMLFQATHTTKQALAPSGVAYISPPIQQSGFKATVDAELKKKLDYLEAQAKQRYEEMTEEARAQAAQKLNTELHLEPPLTGHETWAQVSAVVGSAGGKAAGEALCGEACGKLGSMAGAYLGEKLGPLLEKKYDALKAYCVDKWGEVRAWVEDKVDDIEDWISGLNPF